MLGVRFGYSHSWISFLTFTLLSAEIARPIEFFKAIPLLRSAEDLMTVQQCIDNCAAAGHTSAGLEFGRECYCDNVLFPPSQSGPFTDYDMGCLGDASA